VKNLQARVMGLRDQYSRLSCDARSRQAALDELGAQFEVDRQSTEQVSSGTLALTEKKQHLTIQYKAVQLKQQEQLENRELNEIQVAALQQALQDKVVAIQGFKELDAENSVLMKRVGNRGHDENQKLQLVLAEKADYMDDMQQLQDNMAGHIAQIKRLSECTVSTLKVVTHGERQRQAAKAERRRLRITAAAVKTAATAQRAVASSAVTAFSHAKLDRFEAAFRAIMTKTGLPASVEFPAVADIIVDRIVSKPGVIADLQAMLEQQRVRQGGLEAEKEGCHAELQQLRESQTSSSVMKRVEEAEALCSRAAFACEQKQEGLHRRMARLVTVSMGLRAMVAKAAREAPGAVSAHYAADEDSRVLTEGEAGRICEGLVVLASAAPRPCNMGNLRGGPSC
jgi:hypothetical protein